MGDSEDGVVPRSHTEEEGAGSPSSTTVESTAGAADWTDKKHSLYLNSMEESFINQLYHTHDSPARTQSSQRSSINVQRGGEFSEFKNKPHSLSGSRRRSGHFRSSFPIACLHSAEVSDQNFADDDKKMRGTDGGQKRLKQAVFASLGAAKNHSHTYC